MRTYRIQYNIGSTSASYKVKAASRRVALDRFRAAMAHPPITPSGELMWSSVITFARKPVTQYRFAA